MASPQAWHDLRAAIAQHKQGEVRAALTVYERIIACEPANAQALRYLGVAKFQLGQRAAGLECLKRATAAAPEDAPAWSDLGRMYAIAGKTQQAIACFRKAIAVDANFSDGWHNLGAALRQARDANGALAAYRQALALNPKRADTYLNLGNLLVDDNQPENAIESFRRAALLDPKLAQARASLAGELSGRGDVTEAEFVYRQAIALNPEHAQAWFGLGRTLEDLGHAEQAARCYRQVLKLHPQQPWALGQLLGLQGPDAEAALIRDAQRTLDAQRIPDGAEALIGYGLGKVHDRRGDYDAAFAAFERANRARRAQAGAFDAAEFEQRVDRIIDLFSADFFAERRRFGIGVDLPVFIVGMPRSGTTLTEQILDSHPRMFGAGELPHVAELTTDLPARFNLDAPWPLCAPTLTAMQAHEAAHLYFDRLRAKAPESALRASDKSPLNFFHLGLIALLFPNARIVHCRRNPIDTCLSIYFENFRSSQTHATDLHDLAIYYRGYERLMAHWLDVLPLKVHEVQYEESVVDVERQARRLVEFLGVAWDQRCLDFHQSRRAVQTPSRWQVRKTIYTSSANRWRHYEKHIATLKSAFPKWLRAK
ncbi:MAG: tetratricopeptide repeat-containing sulfotransferase family protein [Gammaproteobacteria bacterium]